MSCRPPAGAGDACRRPADGLRGAARPCCSAAAHPCLASHARPTLRAGGLYRAVQPAPTLQRPRELHAVARHPSPSASDAVRRLVGAGAAVDALTGPEGLTPLALALTNHEAAACEAAGGRAASRGRARGRRHPQRRRPPAAPCLRACARRGLPAAGVVRLLLAAGADPAALNAAGQAPLHILLEGSTMSGHALAALQVGTAQLAVPHAGMPAYAVQMRGPLSTVPEAVTHPQPCCPPPQRCCCWRVRHRPTSPATACHRCMRQRAWPTAASPRT